MQMLSHGLPPQQLQARFAHLLSFPQQQSGIMGKQTAYADIGCAVY